MWSSLFFVSQTNYRLLESTAETRKTSQILHLHLPLYNLTYIVDQKLPILILGDFNINVHAATNQYTRLATYMSQQYGYDQYMQDFTTDKQTTIDLLFTNTPSHLFQWGTLESYFSYHKPLWVALDQD
jgi:endonuclease/exonuclease/phosphatase family metal-dependent hydrolase